MDNKAGNYFGENIGTGEIADDAVTLAKLENGTQGDVLYYGAAGAPSRLSAGSLGQILKSGGAGANPSWTNGGGILFLGTLAGNSTSTTESELATTTISAATLGANDRLLIVAFEDFDGGAESTTGFVRVAIAATNFDLTAFSKVEQQTSLISNAPAKTGNNQGQYVYFGTASGASYFNSANFDLTAAVTISLRGRVVSGTNKIYMRASIFQIKGA